MHSTPKPQVQRRQITHIDTPRYYGDAPRTIFSPKSHLNAPIPKTSTLSPLAKGINPIAEKFEKLATKDFTKDIEQTPIIFDFKSPILKQMQKPAKKFDPKNLF